MTETLSPENQHALDLLGGRRLRCLDTFSGIGGLAQAVSPWCETVAYCEWKRTSQAILLSRMLRGEIDRAPIWDDVQTLRPESVPGTIDIIVGGFPCQDISNAGKKLGMDGVRSVLYRESLRLARAFRPEYLFFENVSAILVRGGDAVVADLAALGYDSRWETLCAPDADPSASHSRERWFCLARRADAGGLPDSTGIRAGIGGPPGEGGPGEPGGQGSEGRGPLADADLLGREDGRAQPQPADLEGPGDQEGQGRHSPAVSAVHSDQGGQDRRGLGGEPGPELGGVALAAPRWPPRPPRPGDKIGWENHLARFPGSQPALFGDADGLRPDRRDAVGSYGNGVDVVTARVAFRYLLTGRFRQEY